MKVLYSLTALRQLESFPLQLQERIVGKMIFYATQDNPLRFADHVTHYSEYRFRIGDYRVRFKVKDDVIIVMTIKRRDKAYE